MDKLDNNQFSDHHLEELQNVVFSGKKQFYENKMINLRTPTEL